MPHHRREVSRIEGLSDAVFAFAITLLVVSLEVPETFDELSNLGLGAIGLASAAVAAIMGRLAPNLVGVAGWVYFLIGLVEWWVGAYRGRSRQAIAPG
ncbi:MAG TPA: TMEM175 family protein [Vicinamibacterales bacterium]|nr:TMEM175 family protein [Vicinamibacterales bacterium]